MSKPISIPTTFGALTGPIPLSTLDGNFGAVSSAINDISTYSNYFVDGGVVNAMTVTTTGLTFAYNAGIRLQVKVSNTNTSTAVTLNVNGLGNIAVLNQDGTLPTVGQLVSGTIIDLIYNGSSFVLAGSSKYALNNAYKSSTQSIISSNTLTVDSALSVPLGVGSYCFDCMVYVNASGPNGNMGFNFNMLFSGTYDPNSYYQGVGVIAGAGPVINSLQLGATYGTPNTFVTIGAGAGQWVNLKGNIKTLTAGNFAFAWSPNSIVARNLNVLAGSYLTTMQLA